MLYSPNLQYPQIFSHQFLGHVMTRIAQGFTDSILAASEGGIAEKLAVSFKHELEEQEGVCSVYQTVWARKMEIGRSVGPVSVGAA
jgi:hypothetical protein